jgi:hypothetical protein
LVTDLETRPEARNDCAGEGQQQFNRLTDYNADHINAKRELDTDTADPLYGVAVKNSNHVFA